MLRYLFFYFFRLETLSLDVTREDAISSVAAQVQSRHSGLDLLINCAAMLHPSGRGETALSQVTAEVCAGNHMILMLPSLGLISKWHHIWKRVKISFILIAILIIRSGHRLHAPRQLHCRDMDKHMARTDNHFSSNSSSNNSIHISICHCRSFEVPWKR